MFSTFFDFAASEFYFHGSPSPVIKGYYQIGFQAAVVVVMSDCSAKRLGINPQITGAK